jgi:CBS domain-containing protein
MRISDLMKKPPVTVTPETPLVKAAKIMEHAGVGALLVLDHGRLTGVVTDRDIVVRGVAMGLPGDARIDGVMTTEPVTVDVNDDLSAATKALSEKKFRRLPVTEAGVVVGMLSADDLLLSLVSDLSDVVWPIFGEVIDPQHVGALPVPAQSATTGG